MPGFGWVQEERGRPGTRKRGSDLPCDVPRLTHSGDNNAPLAGQADAACVRKTAVKPRRKCRNGLGFYRQGSAGRGQELGIVGG